MRVKIIKGQSDPVRFWAIVRNPDRKNIRRRPFEIPGVASPSPLLNAVTPRRFVANKMSFVPLASSSQRSFPPNAGSASISMITPLAAATGVA